MVQRYYFYFIKQKERRSLMQIRKQTAKLLNENEPNYWIPLNLISFAPEKRKKSMSTNDDKPRVITDNFSAGNWHTEQHPYDCVTVVGRLHGICRTIARHMWGDCAAYVTQSTTLGFLTERYESIPLIDIGFTLFPPKEVSIFIPLRLILYYEP